MLLFALCALAPAPAGAKGQQPIVLASGYGSQVENLYLPPNPSGIRLNIGPAPHGAASDGSGQTGRVYNPDSILTPSFGFANRLNTQTPAWEGYRAGGDESTQTRNDAYKLGPITARFQVSSNMSKPGAWRGDLLGPVNSRPGALPSYLTYSALSEQDQYQGTVALEWRSGFIGVTLGGGFSKTYAAADGSGGVSSGSRGASSVGSASSASRYDSYSRYAAFVAVPMAVNGRLSVSPEVSYYYDDKPEDMREKEDEWVLGVQFRIGF